MTQHTLVTIERHNADGVLVERFEGNNIVTQVGEQMYAERGAGVTSPPAAPTGMKLGTGGGSAAKTGTGAALTTYLAGSNKAFDSTFPQSSLNGLTRRITYKRTYAAGQATSTDPITEAVIVNDTIATDATSSSANTISRILVNGITAKLAGDTLTAIWIHEVSGSDPGVGGSLSGLNMTKS